MKIAIQGHPTRGKEVIQILNNLGGENTERLTGSYKTFYYIDDKNKIIDNHKTYLPSTYKFYTLEEFEKEFPFKIGDKITITGLPDFPKIITKITWDCDAILYSFEDSNNTWFHVDALRKLEMKEERNITLTLDKAKEWYKKGGELKEIALQVFTEKELTKVELPRSWEEFCKTHDIMPNETIISGKNSNTSCIGVRIRRDTRDDRNLCPSQKSAEAHLAMIQLEQLRDCWRNGWKPMSEKAAYSIKVYVGKLGVFYYCTREFLSFPTREIAEEFLECFKDLIEKARDLI